MLREMPPRAHDGFVSLPDPDSCLRPSPSVPSIRVAIVGHPNLYRHELEQWISATSDVRCIYAGDDQAAALREIPPHAPHVILVGPTARHADFDCIVRLRGLLANAEFLVFAIEPDSDMALKAFAAGATGCLSHHTPPERVLAAVRDVHCGGAPLSPDIAARVVRHIRQRKRPTAGTPRLSARQARILASISRGLATSEIASDMGLRPETVRSYLKLIYRKLRVHNRTEAVMRYFGGTAC